MQESFRHLAEAPARQEMHGSGIGAKPLRRERGYFDAGANTANMPAYGFTMNAGAPS